MRKLIERADVLVENYVPGKLWGLLHTVYIPKQLTESHRSTMGLGFEDCQKLNPRLVYASITGYGQTGPFSQAPGYDVVVEAEAGLMHMYVYLDMPLLRLSAQRMVVVQANLMGHHVKSVLQ
jgi:succinate--hydroxymethylglutarate CoA-transferase